MSQPSGGSPCPGRNPLRREPSASTPRNNQPQPGWAAVSPVEVEDEHQQLSFGSSSSSSPSVYSFSDDSSSGSSSGYSGCAPTDCGFFHLTRENFSHVISQNREVFVQFYNSSAPSAGPRAEYAEQMFQQAADAACGTQVFAVVDCADEQRLCEQENIPMFPFVKSYVNGQLVGSQGY